MAVSRKSTEFNVGNLSRGLDILELLQEHPAGLGLSDIQQQLKLSLNAAFRITSALCERGYLVRHEASKKYALSRKLMTLGYRVANEDDLIEVSLPHLRRLRDEVGEMVVVCGMLETEAVVLDAVPGSHAFRFTVDTGMTTPLHASAHGKAMLAALPEESRDHLLAKLRLTRHTATTITTRPALLKELERIREVGYALDRAEGFDGVHCVSAAIRNAKGVPVAAVTVTGPAFRFLASDLPKAGPKVVACAAAISKRLGYQGFRSS